MTTAPAKTTPMLEHFYQVKREYPDTLIFYRMGEFYEMFGQDAVIGSGILDIALTSRDKKKANALPMCGIPAHSYETYVNKLTKAGHKVAICDQLEDPAQAKGLVKRGVTRVITPGTVLSTQLLEEGKNQFIAALAWEENNPILGVAFADLTTGEFEFEQGSLLSVSELIQRFQPVELLFSADAEGALPSSCRDCLQGLHKQPHLEALSPQAFHLQTARRALLEHFALQSLDPFGLENKPQAQQACGALLGYLQATQKNALRHLTHLKTAPRQGVMLLDEATIRNLELFEPLQTSLEDHSLIRLLDQTQTPMGARLLKRWLLTPLTDRAALSKRHQAVAYLIRQFYQAEELIQLLKGVNDLERILARLSLPLGGLNDLLRLRSGLAPLGELARALQALDEPALQQDFAQFDPLLDQYELLSGYLQDQPNLKTGEGGYIRPGVNRELDELRSLGQDSKSHLAALEEREKTRTGIHSLKVGYNRVFGYYLEISNANKHLAPKEYIRKQTLANAERYLTPELKELEEKITSAEEEAREIEQELLRRLLDQIKGQLSRIQRTARRVAQIDVLCNLAALARSRNYSRPELLAKEAPPRLRILGGRHPVIESLFEEEPFIANDCELDSKTQYISVITGPNMGGKSTYMRQVALICLLAQMGSFVPAQKAVLPLFERVFTRVGAADNLARGQSTFMVEMNEAAAILNNANERSLVILDEIGRGTSTFDGISIAWSILEFLHKKRVPTLFATHYHELILLEDQLKGVKNEKVEVEEEGEQILFLRKITAGRAHKSYGIQVASLAGLPFEVVMRAKSLLQELERAESNLSGKKQQALRKAASQQLTFAPLEEPWMQDLRDFDLNQSTPLQAMEFLYHLKEKVGK